MNQHDEVYYGKREVKMEEAEYGGKRYRKLKSLAPVEILPDIKTNCEKASFDLYIVWGGFSSFFMEPDFKDFIGWVNRDTTKQRLPWLIQRGYVEEVRDEREEHYLKFFKWAIDHKVSQSWQREYWDYFDKNPVPNEKKQGE